MNARELKAQAIVAGGKITRGPGGYLGLIGANCTAAVHQREANLPRARTRHRARRRRIAATTRAARTR